MLIKIFFLSLISINLFALESPYLNFKNILDKVKLQAPTSKYNKKYSIKKGEFKNKYNKFFYLKNNLMTFNICGFHNRSELREINEWSTNTKKTKSLSGEVYLDITNPIKEFTFLQIHSNLNPNNKNGKEINKPLLRIAYISKRKNIHNHIWAIIRKSVKQNKYKYIDLGEYKNNFLYFKISVNNNNLNLNLNKKIYKEDISYWEDQSNYFKAGVYLQDNSCSKVKFKKLKLIE